MQFICACSTPPVRLLWYLRSNYSACCRQTVCCRKSSAHQEQGLAQVDVHNVVADLSVTSEVEALAADLPPAFREVRRLP